MEKKIFEEKDLPKLKKDKEKENYKQSVTKNKTSNNKNNQNTTKKKTDTNNSNKKKVIENSSKSIIENNENLSKPNKKEEEKDLPTEHVKLDEILERLARERQKQLEEETKVNKKKTKLKLRKGVGLILLFICFGVFIFSVSKIYIWHQENKEVDKQMTEIEQIIEIEEVKEGDEEVKIEQVNPPKQEDKNNDYWNYIKLPLISVNFKELKKKNSDTVAYLKVNGTNINYPVVQTSDNKYYLTHSFDKSTNSAGWVFMDYRNDASNLQDNTIIYAHGRVNTTMFGSLKNVFKNNWYQNTDNYIVNLSTPEENTLWQVISVYQIATTTDYLTSSFGTEESKQKFIDMILERSKYDFKTDVNTDDKILTLSTCANKDEKVVLHAKLIKKQVRN